MNISRERLEEIAIAYGSGHHTKVNVKDDEVLQIVEALLAAHEQEPVAYSLIFRNMDGVLNSGINTNTTFATREKAEAYGKGGRYEAQHDGSLKWVADENLDPVVVPLYTHSAPSIQAAVPDFDTWFKREFHPDKTGPYVKDQMRFCWNACRAAMLNGG